MMPGIRVPGCHLRWRSVRVIASRPASCKRASLVQGNAGSSRALAFSSGHCSVASVASLETALQLSLLHSPPAGDRTLKRKADALRSATGEFFSVRAVQEKRPHGTAAFCRWFFYLKWFMKWICFIKLMYQFHSPIEFLKKKINLIFQLILGVGTWRQHPEKWQGHHCSLNIFYLAPECIKLLSGKNENTDVGEPPADWWRLTFADTL